MKTQTLRHLKGLISLVGIASLSFFGFFLNIDKGENKSRKEKVDINQTEVFDEFTITSYNADDDGYESAPESGYPSRDVTGLDVTYNSTYDGWILNGIQVSYGTGENKEHPARDFDITVPATYKSDNVTRNIVGIASNLKTYVYDSAYGWPHYDPLHVHRLILPSTLKYIGDNAFVSVEQRYTSSNDWRNADDNKDFNEATYDLSACTNLEYIGANAFGSGAQGEIVKIPATLEKLTTVGDNAFKSAIVKTYNENNQISMPNVKTIGISAFQGCIGLKKVDFATVETMGERAFQGCTSIENITLPQTLTTLGDYTFKSCTNLATVTSNSPRLSVGEFQDCPQMNLSKLNTTVTAVPDYCFDGCSTLKNEEKFANIITIGDFAFRNSGLESFVSATGLKNIGNNAFEGASLTEITFPVLETIGNNAFKNCVYLNNNGTFSIPATIQSVGENAFEGCRALTKVTFHKDILSKAMFKGCTLLSTVVYNNPTAVSLAVIPDECFMNCSSMAVNELITTEKTNIVSIGKYAFYNTIIPTISLTKNQNSIGEYAFAMNENLTSVTIDVSMISDHMFYKCRALQTVVIGSRVNASSKDELVETIGDYAFAECPNITSITFGNNAIGNYMFYKNIGLREVVIPAAISYVGDHAFDGCTLLENATVATINLGQNMFTGTTSLANIEFAEGLTTIPAYAFYQSYLKSVTIPSTVTFVGDYAFADSDALVNINLNSSYIGNHMFDDCDSIVEINIPETTFIGEYAFANCDKLEIADISRVNQISIGMFKGCGYFYSDTTKTLVIPNVSSIGESAFEDCIRLYDISINSTILSDYMFKGCKAIHNVTIPQTVTEIGVGVFQNCSNISRAEINNSAATDHMFDGCTGLASVTFTTNATAIGAYAFKNCTNLATLNIDFPTIGTIGTYAFQNCKNLTSLTINAGVRSIGEGAISGCTKLSSINIPFVGSGKTSAEAIGTASKETLFGYIFGSLDVDNTTLAVSKYSNTETYNSYIPNSLKNVIIHNEEVIQYGAFYNVPNVEKITFNSNIKVIQDYAFYDANSLMTLNIPVTVEYIGEYAVAECDNFGFNQVTGEYILSGNDLPIVNTTVMGNHMFENNKKLKVIDLPNVAAVANYAFKGCENLTTVNLNTKVNVSEPNDVLCLSIGAHAFEDCISLDTILLSNAVESIGDYAFANCINVKLQSALKNTAVLPYRLTTIGEHAFDGDLNIVNLVIPENVVTIDTHAFANCTGLIMVTFENDIMGDYMFANDTNLKDVYLGDVPSINTHAFTNCSNLNYISIPSSVTEIGAYAFDNSGLISIVVPATVTTIDVYGFANCHNLEFATVYTSIISSHMFENDENLVDLIL